MKKRNNFVKDKKENTLEKEKTKEKQRRKKWKGLKEINYWRKL